MQRVDHGDGKGAWPLRPLRCNFARHRAPFAAPFRPTAVKERFAAPAEAEASRLIDGFVDRGRAELRREFAGPLAASIMARVSERLSRS